MIDTKKYIGDKTPLKDRKSQLEKAEEIFDMTFSNMWDESLVASILDSDDEAKKQLFLEVMVRKAQRVGRKRAMQKLIKTTEQKRLNAFAPVNYIDLERDDNGKPMPTVQNFVNVLEKDIEFEGLRFNLLTNSPENIYGERFVDVDEANCMNYIENTYHFYNDKKCQKALRIIFHKNEYHPIREKIEHLIWDGKERLGEFLHNTTKCDNTPYTREVSRLIFAGGINRLFNPGCKFDDVPVLIGSQGAGKSTLVRWLAMCDDWFTEICEIEGNRSVEALMGAWICEVSELLAMTKAREQEAVKSYFSRLVDRYRVPYDKYPTDNKRQCIFIGTTNKEQFLTDKTGNRRFYPVKTFNTGRELFENEEHIKHEIEQCWAEAHRLYKEGKLPAVVDRDVIKDVMSEQAHAVEDDYREGMLVDFLENVHETCVLQIWRKAFNMSEFTTPSKKDSNEIGLMMQALPNWQRQPKPKRFGVYGFQRYWSKIHLEEESRIENGELRIENGELRIENETTCGGEWDEIQLPTEWDEIQLPSEWDEIPPPSEWDEPIREYDLEETDPEDYEFEFGF